MLNLKGFGNKEQLLDFCESITSVLAWVRYLKYGMQSQFLI